MTRKTKNYLEYRDKIMKEWKSHIEEIYDLIDSYNEKYNYEKQVHVANYLYIPTVYMYNDARCQILYPMENNQWATGYVASPETLMISSEVDDLVVYDEFNSALKAFEYQISV